MKKLFGLAVVGAALSLAACGDGTDQSARDSADETTLDAGTTSADMAATGKGAGDMSSAAGAGAATNAMDGGRAGDDGAPPAGEGEGGPGDALQGEADSAR